MSDFATLDLATSLPINIIKIGTEITENVSKSPLSNYMAKVITGFAEDMSIGVCATGIGDAETEQKLKDYHIDSVQGYYYSRPVSLEDFKKLDMYKQI